MKLTELTVIEVDLNKYTHLIKKTEDECLKTINNSPKVFVLTLIKNSTELQELGDTNEWESDLDVWKHVENNYLKKDKTGGIDTKDLFKIVYTTLSEKYVKPKEPTKPAKSKVTSGSNKPKELTFDLNEGLMGEEIQYDKKTILSKSQFEAKIKEENGENKDYQFEYTLNQAKVLIKPLSKETEEEEEEVEEEAEVEAKEEKVKETKKEKKKKEPKVKQEKETEETKEDVKVEEEVKEEKKEEIEEVTVEADDEDDFDW